MPNETTLKESSNLGPASPPNRDSQPTNRTRWRAVIIGTLLLPANAYWIASGEATSTTVSLFFNIVFILFVLLLLNLLFKQIAPSHRVESGRTTDCLCDAVDLLWNCGTRHDAGVDGGFSGTVLVCTPGERVGGTFLAIYPELARRPRQGDSERVRRRRD